MIVVRVEIAMILLLLMVIMMKFMMMAKMVLISKMMMAMVTSAPCRCTGRRCRWTLLQSRSSALSVSPARQQKNLKCYGKQNQNVNELKRIWIREENVWREQNGEVLIMRMWMVNDTYMVKEGHKEFSGNEIRNCIFLYFYLLTRDSPTPVWHLSSLTPEKSTLWTPSNTLTM